MVYACCSFLVVVLWIYKYVLLAAMHSYDTELKFKEGN